MTDYDRICKEIFPLMSAWGRAIENGEPYQEHLTRLEHIAIQDPMTMHEALTSAIGINRMRAEYVMSDDYNEEAVGRKDPYLYGLSREKTRDVFLQRMERNISLLEHLALADI